MNTQNKEHNKVHLINKISRKLMIGGLLILSITSVSAGNFQQNMLFSPSPSVLADEAKGRVMIYDGLKSETVDKAMNVQFSRIDSMMFVNTEYKKENGEIVANDDCSD
mgnify:CR=1 FL=1